MRSSLSRRIAGDVVFADSPGAAMRHWRELFGISQTTLGRRLGTSASVVSDYELGRRSPGSRLIRRFVEALIAIDEESGGKHIRELVRTMSTLPDAILDLRDFTFPVKGRLFCEVVDGTVLACEEGLAQSIYGYTVVDSVKAILTLSGYDFMSLVGSTTERALIFTGVTFGRSPMVAIRLYPLKPRIVALHGLKEESVDRDLAVKIAENERIPLLVSKAPSVTSLIQSLRSLEERTQPASLKGGSNTHDP
ncbi:MAG: helix-turn-helix domain-containing protein [Candidatus Bathyarchaeia archaeon]